MAEHDVQKDRFCGKCVPADSTEKCRVVFEHRVECEKRRHLNGSGSESYPFIRLLHSLSQICMFVFSSKLPINPTYERRGHIIGLRRVSITPVPIFREVVQKEKETEDLRIDSVVTSRRQ